MDLREIELDHISCDPELQTRFVINRDVVTDYAERMRAGDKFPPLRVFDAGGDYFLLSRGFHRYEAAADAGLRKFDCEVEIGGKEDAQLDACADNAAHGLQRTIKDKQIIVHRCLLLRADQWNNQRIAEHCRVTVPFVAGMRVGMEEDGAIKHVESLPGADGKTYPTRHAAEPVPCCVCGSTERDEDGECAKCHDPDPEHPEGERPLPAPSDPHESEIGRALAEAGAEPVILPESVERLDCVGKRVPLRLIGLFAGRSAAAAVVGRIRTVWGEVPAMRVYREAALQPLRERLEQTAVEIEAVLPYAICPTCSGAGCEACKERGWLPEGVYRNEPKMFDFGPMSKV